MPSNGAAKPVRSGLSLYANLLDPAGSDSVPGTISGAPVVYKQSQANSVQQEAPVVDKQQISAGALRFQPTKRPNVSTQKQKVKALVQRSPAPPPAASAPEASPDPLGVTNRVPAKTTLADWTADGDDNDVNGFYAGEKRQRGGRKKRKKNKEEARILQNWDDIYDPSRPNIYEDYKNSEEYMMEIREWKDRLYAHRMARRESGESVSDAESHYKPAMNTKSFAPPPTFDDTNQPPPPPVSEPPHIRDDPKGEVANAQGMQIFQSPNQPTYPSQEPSTLQSMTTGPNTTSEAKQPQVLASVTKPSISRAPVRYNLPPPPTEIPSSEAELERAIEKEEEAPDTPPRATDVPRSLRPGQKGFAERLMSKYGWNKGSGLGASGSGITAPLRVQVEKQKKKPDCEGGGFVGPGGMGKIIGGKREGGAGTGKGQEGKFGAMGEVVILKGMVDGMDLDAEIGAGDGGLMQEIGEECGEKYGRVERVFINRNSSAEPPVFVKFTSQLSALRAVNALEGRIFNGNTITARFFDVEKFDSGVFE